MREKKLGSRKFWLATIIVLLVTILFAGPGIINLILGTSFVLLSGSEYASIIVGVFGLYSGANVAEKHVSGNLISKMGKIIDDVALDVDLEDGIPPVPSKTANTKLNLDARTLTGLKIGFSK